MILLIARTKLVQVSANGTLQPSKPTCPRKICPLESTAMPERLALDLNTIIQPQSGWVGGDFHCHTLHSDGALTPPELVAQAQREGMGFFAITDHNTLDAYPHFGLLNDICIIPGLEVTFVAGHYNVFGLSEKADWQEPVIHGPTAIDHAARQIDINGLLAASAGAGLLNSINHPLLPPWAWLLGAVELRHVHCLEIWNDPSWPENRVGNPLAVAMWTRWLNAGHRITAIGGSDFHRPVNKPGVLKPPDRLGTPRTYIYAEALSGAAILTGLRRRQVYVSMGAQVEFTAQLGTQRYAIGAEVGIQPGTLELTATVTTTHATGTARLLHNGAILAEALLMGEPLTLTATVPLDGQTPSWFRFDVVDGNGLLLALTNPIFAGPTPTATLTRYGDFVDVDKIALR